MTDDRRCNFHSSGRKKRKTSRPTHTQTHTRTHTHRQNLFVFTSKTKRMIQSCSKQAIFSKDNSLEWVSEKLRGHRFHSWQDWFHNIYFHMSFRVYAKLIILNQHKILITKTWSGAEIHTNLRICVGQTHSQSEITGKVPPIIKKIFRHYKNTKHIIKIISNWFI